MMIARRNMLFAAAGGVLMVPRLAWAQRDKIWRIAYLTPRSEPVPPAHDAFSDALTTGMTALGYVEGKNLVIDRRYANGNYELLSGLAAKLVQTTPDVIVSYGTPASRALQSASTTTPIVIAAAIDLVGSHFVASLARPGGNITGLSVIDVDLSGKQLELLRTLMPALARVAVLINPGNPAHALVLKSVVSAATGLGISVEAVDASAPEGIDDAFGTIARNRAEAVIVAADAFFSEQGRSIADAALKNRIATVGVYHDHVAAGTLTSYGPDIAAYHRKAATYVDKILRGARPADLPAEEPTRIELALNSETARNLGLQIPARLLPALTM